ncbi:hypothetical protein MKQ70_29170 [Chitinophaga sedimenti]|uniref:hypothetical protein n=1 Tax=Chitinophaga sedimenti TaxID=2033606 RepID=UPI002004A74E|nr:hypothetical protein [Chitinophaga sedimenti]MCK7558834.1 hypothetical protein [Chitinophaga sedimenti]
MLQMHTIHGPTIPEEKLRSIVSQFLKTIHEAGGKGISHITITIHGCVSHFTTSKKTHAVAIPNTGNTKTLYYRELVVEAPIRNMITIIASPGEAG